MIDISLKNKVVFITGASRGIGAGIAAMLGQSGATVVGTATTDEGAAAITERLHAAGCKGQGMKMDVTNSEHIDDVVARITVEYGAPLILVNNAGITRDNLLARMKDEEWNAIIDTNLSSIFRISKACLRPMMKARFGRIISISSVVGATGNSGQTNYAAAKAGLIGFSKSLAQEIGSRNITVNVVAPGFIDTDMTKGLQPEQQSALLNQIPLGRLGSPEDIAAAVLFLASDYAGYITGETIHVNGGMHMS